MKNGKSWRAFIAGMVTMALLLAVAVPSFAAGAIKTIQARIGGITIVVDGKKIQPTDANGNAVEPMIYNGTTYLPVRAVSSALGKAVYWDGQNWTVYLGKMDGKLEYPTVMLKDMKSIDQEPKMMNKLIDNYGNSYSSAIVNGMAAINLEYLLDMKYSKFRGVLYVPEGADGTGTCVLTVTADGRQIYTSPVMNKTSKPVSIDVNVTGYNDVKIQFSGVQNLNNGALTLCLADAGFYQ